jgi:hypothetical protein
MAKDLVVGNASVDCIRDELVAYAESLGLGERVRRLFDDPGEETTLFFLRGSGVMLFLDHVASLEGHADHQSAFAALQRGDTVFKNMPWWDDAVWLPFDVPRVGTTNDDPKTFPTFVGSCTALMKELEEIRRRSPLELGAKPPGYDKMRQDISAFYRDREFRLDDPDVIPWIWLALHDGATLAIDRQAILWCGPD